MSTDKNLVRPRWVWGGLLLAIVGTAVIGVGIAAHSWWVTSVGIVLLLLGTGASVRGGVLYDAHASRAMKHELHDLASAEPHQGVAPSDHLDDERSVREARASSRTASAARDASRGPRHPALAPLGAILLLFVAAFFLGVQGLLYAHTATGQHNATRDLGLGVVIALLGLRALLSPGRHLLVVVLAVLCGLGLVASGVYAGHSTELVPWVEGACGVLVVIGGLLCLSVTDSADRERG